MTSSALPVANERGRLSPDPVHAPPRGMGGSGTVRGVTVSGTVVRKVRPSSIRPNGSVTRTVIGPISKLASHVGADLVGHVSSPAVGDALEHEAGTGAQHVGHLVLEQQHAARGPPLVGEREGDRGGLAGRHELRGHGAHQREPVAAAAQHAR